MTEVEQTLDTHKEIALSHEEIKQQLTEQKVCVSYNGEFQLGSCGECLHRSFTLTLGVPEVAAVKEAHVRSYIEEWTQPP